MTNQNSVYIVKEFAKEIAHLICLYQPKERVMIEKLVKNHEKTQKNDCLNKNQIAYF